VSYQILEYSTVLVNMYLSSAIYMRVWRSKGPAQPETIFSQKLHGIRAGGNAGWLLVVNRRSAAQVYELELRRVLAGSRRRKEKPRCRSSAGEVSVGGAPGEENR
jgi:hypothetical protein